MSEKLSSIQVPDQLYPLITDDMRDVFDEWKTKTLREVISELPAPTVFDINGRQALATLLPARTSEKSDTTLVINTEHQQRLNGAHTAQLLLLQHAIAPEHDVVIFANNSIKSENYSVTPEDRVILEAGDFTPYAEMQSEVLTALRIGKIAGPGYSLGARQLAGLAAIGSHEFVAINGDEPPTKALRTPDELQKDFLRSGGWGAQRAAIKDADVGAILEAYKPYRLAIDYAKFGIAVLLNKDNAAMKGAMQGSITPDMLRALLANPEMTIKLGQVAGSFITDLSDTETQTMLAQYGDRVRTVEYTGEGARGHATSNNAVAHALMALDGLGHVLGK